MSVDTLRSDRIGAYGGDGGLTPEIDALARQSLRFTSVYAPTSHTLPSVAALLSGRYPEELGIWSNLSRLPAATPTLATVLRDAGWHTAAVVSNWVLREASGLDAGFDLFDARFPRLEAARHMPERVAADTTDAALEALDSCLPDARSRCFLWVHYQDPHGPYTPPGDRRERFLARERAEADGRRQLPALPGPFGTGGIPSYQLLDGQREVAFYRAGYAGEVAALDEELGRLLEGLRRRGLESASVIAFTADHGESLGEDDYWFGHGEFLSDALVRVPLLVRRPGAAPGVRDDVASLVDLVPSLTALLDVPAVSSDLPGRPLFAPGAEATGSTPYLAALRGSKVPRIGLVTDEFKYLSEERNGIWHGRLLRREDESVDLTAPAPHVAAAMRAQLKIAVERYHRSDEESLQAVSPDARTRLEALGYAEPEAR